MPLFLVDEGLRTFRIFSAGHLIAFTIEVAVLTGLVALAGRWQPTPRWDRTLRFSAGVTLLGLEWACYAWHLWRGDPIRSFFPFQVCSISLYTTAILLFSDQERWFRFICPWAVVGATLSFVVAEQEYSFPHLRYLHYFLNHGIFLAANVYYGAIRGWRIRYLDLLRSAGILFIVALAAWGVNAVLGTNYLFMGHLPPEATFLFAGMGPFWRVGYVLGIFLAFHLAWWPFRVRGR